MGFFFLGIFHSIRQYMEQPICPTWRTPVCLACQLSSTSSWLWWSPRATLTRNLFTTMVGHQKCPRMIIWDWKGGMHLDPSWHNDKFIVSALLNIRDLMFFSSYLSSDFPLSTVSPLCPSDLAGCVSWAGCLPMVSTVQHLWYEFQNAARRSGCSQLTHLFCCGGEWSYETLMFPLRTIVNLHVHEK